MGVYTCCILYVKTELELQRISRFFFIISLAAAHPTISLSPPSLPETSTHSRGFCCRPLGAATAWFATVFLLSVLPSGDVHYMNMTTTTLSILYLCVYHVYFFLPFSSSPFFIFFFYFNPEFYREKKKKIFLKIQRDLRETVFFILFFILFPSTFS